MSLYDAVMAPITPLRAIVALLTLFALGWVAISLEAPVGAAIAALGGGLLAGLILWAGRGPATEGDEPVAEHQAVSAEADPPEGPTLEELMNALDEPSLLVTGRRVERANAAARALLGEHIVGEDVRLAIRHPVAAGRLIGENEDEDSRTAIELVGIGERERPWELVIHELGDNSRFVRLADRSNLHTAEKMRVDFVANASHELRTPLTSLLGYIETLQDGAVKDKKTRKRFLEIMHNEASRMQRLIGDLMSLSRIEAERFRPPDEQIALAPLIEEACQSSCIAAGEDPGRIVIHGDANVGTIPGDKAQIAQLVSNLVSNALKYGRPESTVTVRVKALRPDMARLTVEDEGEGIPAEHLPRLTERFYRVDPGRSRKMGGTGLGLAIVKHIVERHRGRLDIESVEGKGTTFIIDLPKNRDRAPAETKNPGPVSSARNENVTGAVADAATAARDSQTSS